MKKWWTNPSILGKVRRKFVTNYHPFVQKDASSITSPRIIPMKKLLLCSALLPLPVHAALVECWPFNNVAAGGVADGTVSLGINGMPAVIRGAGALSTGGAIDLPGGGSNVAAYIDLPNGLISTRSSVTLETWMTISNANNSWQRVFDFGSTDIGNGSPNGGELFSPGGGGQGADYILLAPNQGTNPGAQRLEYRNDFNTVNTTDSSVNLAPLHGTEHLFSFVWEDLGGGLARQGWYLDGNLAVMSGAFAGSLASINDVNNWLGRSNWTGDANMDGTYDQFALYDHAMSAAQVSAAFAAGPVSHVPEPASSLVLAGSLLGLMIRRRRA